MFLLFAVFASPLLGQTNTNALPALAPPCAKMPPTLWEKPAAAIREHPAATLAGVMIFLPLAALVLWQIVKPRPQPFLPPETIAREALTKLLCQPEDGKCLSEISQILRRYCIAAFGLPPGEMTTAELCAALAGSEKNGAELAQVISSFLRECDARKFSPAHPATPVSAAVRALEIVSRAGDRLRSAPVPGAATAQTPRAACPSQTPPHSDAAASGDGRTP